MEKGLILNIEQVYGYIKNLKSLKKGYVTNIFNFEEVENRIKCTEMRFEYDTKSYLNLLCKDNGFYRLFFLIVDLENYHFESPGKTVVCDVFTTQQDALFENLRDKLYSCAFVQYDCVEKWALHSFDTSPVSSVDGYIFGYEKSEEAVYRVLEVFDNYTDNLPNKKDMDTFFKDKKFINIYEVEGHKYVGSLIYSEKKRMAVLEFYFVIEEKRGRGISYLLHDHFYQLVAKEGYKIVSYIHENNLASKAVHQRYGYQKDRLKKYIFIHEI